MRAPIEDTIETLQQPEAQRTAEAPPKPFGGKALMRMISALDRRGFHELADSIVAEIVPGEAHEAVETARVQFSAAPPKSNGAPDSRNTRTTAEGTRARASPRGRHREGARRFVHDRSCDRRDISADRRETEGDYEGIGGPVAMPMAAEASGQPTGVPTPTGPQWRSLGPWTIPNGQTYGSSRVNVSGRVAAIAIHPTNPARVLCGSANGGVWESFDRGGELGATHRLCRDTNSRRARL